MSSFFRLYLKDLKSIYKMGLILFLIELGLRFLNICISYFMKDIDRFGNHYGSNIGRQFSHALFYIYPVILIYIMLIENRAKTIYQLSALPIKKFKILTSKFLAVFSISLMVIILRAIIDTNFWQPFTIDKYKLQYIHKFSEIHGLTYPSNITIAFHKLFSMDLIKSFAFISINQLTFLILTIFPQVMYEIVRKCKLLTWISVFFGEISILWMFLSLLTKNGQMVAQFALIIFFGLILFLSSLVIYEKFKEI